MQHIPYTSLDAIEHGEREMSQFNEDFKQMFGNYPGQGNVKDRQRSDDIHTDLQGNYWGSDFDRGLK